MRVRAGQIVKGPDGTRYRVVRANTVGARKRWWLVKNALASDRPETRADLHRLPIARSCLVDASFGERLVDDACVPYALVLA